MLNFVEVDVVAAMQFCIVSTVLGYLLLCLICCRISCFEDIYYSCDVYTSSCSVDIYCWTMSIEYLSVSFLYALQCVTYAASPPSPPPTATTIKNFHYCRMTAWACLIHVTSNIYVVLI
jgi:hypothetical protein